LIQLLLGSFEPPKNPLITIIEPVVIEQIVTELTLEEKIAQNVFNCDESVYFIRADDATCKLKPVHVPISRENPPQTIKNSSRATSGWYPYGQCTYFVSTQRSVGQWNNARDWTWQAKRDGWSTGSTPVVGAIGQKGNHVVYVTSVNSDGTFSLSEMNYQGVGVVTYRTVSRVGWSFIY